jgi:DNA-binding NarL/FixJ family response regulator
MRVLIVDDSQVIRERLVMLLNEIPGVEIVGQAETVAQAIDALRQFTPDAMILDLRLPDGNGLDVLRLMQRERLPTAVIVLTSYPYPQYEKRARAAGAYAFLNKARDFATIPELLRALMAGGAQRQ